MANDPKYVRLAEHLTRGMRADLNSGFSIAGYDVVEMPDKDEEPERYKFVKGELNVGRMEAASKAEYEEVHPDLYDSLGIEVERPTLTVAAPVPQETQIQAAAQKAGRKVRQGRSTTPEDVLSADEERRKAAIKASKAFEKGKGADEALEEAQEANDAALEAAAEAEAAAEQEEVASAPAPTRGGRRS